VPEGNTSQDVQSTMYNEEGQKLISEHFCAVDSDVTFESCDNVLFKVHRPNLITHSEGFSPPDGTTAMSSEEHVSLSESAEVLELLFQYMYPQRAPDLNKVEFGVLAALSEAAEKYQVYAAINICNIHIETFISEHPFQVLDYAARHGYVDLMFKVEDKYTLPRTMDALEYLSPAVYIAWSRYYMCWLGLLQYAYRAEFDTPFSHEIVKGCKGWSNCFAEVSRRLGGNPASLVNLYPVFRSDTGCSKCQENIIYWRGMVDREKMDRIRAFCTFL